MSLYKSFVIYCHTTISVLIFLALILGPIGVFLLDVDEAKISKLLPHQFYYMPYLISLWCSGINSIYFMLYTVIDYIEYYKTSTKKLIEIKDTLHAVGSYLLFAAVFPISSMISVVFWSFYLYDREMVFPRDLDEFVPGPLNHMMHTLPPFCAILYMLISNKYEPPKAKTFAGMVAVLSTYAACIGRVKMRDGKWVYWALESLNSTQVAIVLTLTVISAIIFFFLGYSINSKIKSFKKYLPSEE